MNKSKKCARAGEESLLCASGASAGVSDESLVGECPRDFLMNMVLELHATM